jgi:hypothetical protein
MSALSEIATWLSGEIAKLGPFDFLEKNPPAEPTEAVASFAH